MKGITLIGALLLVGCGGGGGGGGTEPGPAPTPAPVQAPPQVVVFIGDSITAGWQLPVTGAVNAGIGGNSTSQMLTRFETDVLSKKPTVVVILGGTNDLPGWEEHPELDYANPINITTMADKALAAGARVIVGTIPPTDSPARPDPLIRLYNQRIKEGAPVHGYTVVDYYAALSPFDPADYLDGLHPNAAGYAKMAGALAAVLH